ncbi:hypothetical protein B0H21DRAFT_81416 [Amylocystis lapponica]|nr:hypothetical protein B0H21DRAFT_81416 [Amylocystis lapponica]
MAAHALPQETIDFAHRMFDAARNGDETLLLQALDAGLPANLTNDAGNTLLMLARIAGMQPSSRASLAAGRTRTAPTTAASPRSPAQCSRARTRSCAHSLPEGPIPVSALLPQSRLREYSRKTTFLPCSVPRRRI